MAHKLKSFRINLKELKTEVERLDGRTHASFLSHNMEGLQIVLQRVCNK